MSSRVIESSEVSGDEPIDRIGAVLEEIEFDPAADVTGLLASQFRGRLYGLGARLLAFEREIRVDQTMNRSALRRWIVLLGVIVALDAGMAIAAAFVSNDWITALIFSQVVFVPLLVATWNRFFWSEVVFVHLSAGALPGRGRPDPEPREASAVIELAAGIVLSKNTPTRSGGSRRVMMSFDSPTSFPTVEAVIARLEGLRPLSR